MSLAMANTGRLGGDVAWSECRRLINKYLAGRPVIDHGLDRQCRCGGTAYTQWRRRWYCVRCGRWVRQFAETFHGD